MALALAVALAEIDMTDNITVSRELLRQAIEAFELHAKQYPHMVKGYTLDAATALRAALEQPAPVQEPVAYHTDGVMREVFAQCLTSTYVCSRVWAAWGVGTMSEDDFSPASECDELLDELVQAHKTINALDAKLAQPRKAVKLTPEEIGKAIAAVDRDIYTATKREALISRAIEAAVLKANGVEE